MKIIPAINAQSIQQIKEKVDLLKDQTDFFHLDVAEKDFARSTTWQNPKELDLFDFSKIKFEVHLMKLIKPLELYNWNKAPIKRIIFHPEIVSQPEQVIKIIKKINKEVFLALSPDFQIKTIKPLLKFVAGILILGVSPGPSGQKFNEKVRQKIFQVPSLKKEFTKLKVSLDGGLNEELIKEFRNYQIDYFVIGAFIYQSENPKDVFQKLQASFQKND